MSADQQIEWNYRFDERLGILTQGQSPTVIELALARQDADNWLFRDQCEN